jgi:hypothetical protein
MKYKIVQASELRKSNILSAKHHVIGPLKKVRIAFEGELTLEFHGEVGGEEYERVLARRTENMSKKGVHIGSINSVEDEKSCR